MFLSFVPLGLMLLLLPLHDGRFARTNSSIAMESPWWENYDQQDRYLCSGKNEILLERNESQASIIAGHQRSTLFREGISSNGLLFRNSDMKLTLLGDEMILERFPQTIRCIRTEKV